MSLESRIPKIVKVVDKYFSSNPTENKVIAKNLMPQMVAAGIYEKDFRGGFPLRNDLRDVEKTKQRHKIPTLVCEVDQKNISWFFVKELPKPIEEETPKEIEIKLDNKKEIMPQNFTLDDVLRNTVDVVFCDIAAEIKFGKAPIYYGTYGNIFYSTLQKVGLTPIEISPRNYKVLLHYKIGLCNLALKPIEKDAEPTAESYDTESFKFKMIQNKPKLICFNGKAAAAAYHYNDINKTNGISYGKQSYSIGKTPVMVLPSTSGSEKENWDISFWKELKAILK